MIVERKPLAALCEAKPCSADYSTQRQAVGCGSTVVYKGGHVDLCSMSNPSHKDLEDVLEEMRKKSKIELDRVLARLEEDLKDPEKGPILRVQIRKILQPKSETTMTRGVISRQSTTATKQQRTRRWMYMRRRVDVTITLPKYLLEAIEGLAEMVEKTRSVVIEAFAEYCLDHEDIIDKLFPSRGTG